VWEVPKALKIGKKTLSGTVGQGGPGGEQEKKKTFEPSEQFQKKNKLVLRLGELGRSRGGRSMENLVEGKG